LGESNAESTADVRAAKHAAAQQPIFSTEPLLPAPVHGDPTHWKEGDGDAWHPADYQIYACENMGKPCIDG